MPDSKEFSEYNHFIHVRTTDNLRCNECHRAFDSFASLLDHYVQQEGYKVLHVGQETVEAEMGQQQATVAMLGIKVAPQE